MTHDQTSEVPIIDVAPLVADAGDQEAVAASMGQACRENGFFYVVGHGVSEDLHQRLEELGHAFFAQGGGGTPDLAFLQRAPFKHAYPSRLAKTSRFRNRPRVMSTPGIA